MEIFHSLFPKVLLCTDINPYATAITVKTAIHNSVSLATVFVYENVL